MSGSKETRRVAADDSRLYTLFFPRGALAQLVRAPPCHGGGCGFEPRRLRSFNHLSLPLLEIEPVYATMGRSVFPRMQYNEDYVLGVLHDGGLLTRQQIDGALSRLNGEPGVLDVLINDGTLSEVDVSRTLAAQAHMDWIDISTMIIPPQVIDEIRGEDARRFKVIPVAFGESGLVVAVGNPLDIDTIDSLGFLLQRELELVCTSP